MTVQNDWNEAAVKAVKEKGKDAFHFSKYAASKTLSEQAAWQWIEDEKPGFDLVTIMPTFVLGVCRFHYRKLRIIDYYQPRALY